AASRALETENATPLFSDLYARDLAGDGGFAMMSATRAAMGMPNSSGPEVYLCAQKVFLTETFSRGFVCHLTPEYFGFMLCAPARKNVKTFSGVVMGVSSRGRKTFSCGGVLVGVLGALLVIQLGSERGRAQAPSIAFVQQNYATPQTPQTVVMASYPAAQTAGNLNVVIVGWNDSTVQL